MLVITDSPTFLLEKYSKEKNISVTSILNFPNECRNIDPASAKFVLILLTESFYNNFKERNFSFPFENDKKTFKLLANLIDELSKFGLNIYIPFVPKHFLYNDRFGKYYYEFCSRDLYIDYINNKIYTNFGDSPNITFLKGIGTLSDSLSKNYFRFSSIYDEVNSKLLINQVYIHQSQLVKKPKKLIILDLDNTLWKGILGDDYIEGIRMDESDPIGSIFRSVQRIILNLKDQGFLIAICSKNEEDTAIRALFDNPSCLFNRKDVITYKINWKSKSENISEICGELNISPNDTVFIDDSEYECDEVKTNLPGISVIKVPENIYNYPALLANSPLFDLGISTDEDKVRTDLYKARLKRNSLYSKAKQNDLSKEEWINSLNQKLEITKLNIKARNLDRVIQLFNRTNQFNLTGGKYNKNNFIEILKNKKNIYYYGSASDRIGSEGLISVLGFCFDETKITVLEYILSCRVFGRYIEESMLLPLFKFALNQKKHIYFDFKDTGRNKVIYKFLAQITEESFSLSLKKIKNLYYKYESLLISKSIDQEILK